MADHVEEIKSRIDLADLVREYLSLTNSGSNLKARCPFHQEKSASFMVSPAKQIWHCFGCSTGGDLFSFFMKIEGLEFGEALRILADRAGVVLERHDPRIQGEKNRLTALLDLASQYYHQALLRAPQAETARAYCAQRHLDGALIDTFRIGYALPEYEALNNFLLSRKFTMAEILAVGLAIKKDRGYGCYDRFRDRLIIPITNVHGSVIGFAGRVLTADDQGAKYINSPQTSLYDKGRTVFGLDRTKQEIRKRDAVILVEGYMDFFALYRAGDIHVAATSGTALTVDQIRLLKRFTQNFLFAFDADTAGGQATMRGIELALKEGCNVRVIQLPKDENGVPIYKDPDECVTHESAAWKSVVEQATSFVEYSFGRVITPVAQTDGFEKKKATRRLLEIIGLLPDRIEQDHWIRKLAATLSLSEAILWEELSKTKDRPGRIEASHQGVTPMVPTPHTSSDILMSLLLHRPQQFEQVSGRLEEVMLAGDHARSLYRMFSSFYTEHKNPDVVEDFFESTKKILPADRVQPYFFLAESSLGALSELDVPTVAKSLTEKIRQEYIKERLDLLRHRMNQAEKQNDTTALQEAMREFQIIQSL